MHRLLLVSVSLFAFSVLAQAQETEEPRALAHVFFGGGGTFAEGNAAGTFQVGGGGEGLIYKGFGAGAELGYLFPKQSAGDGFGILSTNGFYRFTNSSSLQKVTPFVTGGYSLGFRNGTANLVNFGGGVDYWVKDRMGLRLEVRDHVWADSGPTAHFLMFRVGLVGR